ncbi:hypothetical protein LV779_17980, partial [Streptomyces thinghirensis]|nr:hypothetical protein [Streptomyces thinghirensis]
ATGAYRVTHARAGRRAGQRRGDGRCASPSVEAARCSRTWYARTVTTQAATGPERAATDPPRPHPHAPLLVTQQAPAEGELRHMSDVTRQPGGSPAERDRQTPDTHGETALGTDRTDEAYPAPGARADHAAGARAETTPAWTPPPRPGTKAPRPGPAREHHHPGRPREHASPARGATSSGSGSSTRWPTSSTRRVPRSRRPTASWRRSPPAHGRRDPPPPHAAPPPGRDTGGDDRATSTDTEQLRAWPCGTTVSWRTA